MPDETAVTVTTSSSAAQGAVGRSGAWTKLFVGVGLFVLCVVFHSGPLLGGDWHTGEPYTGVIKVARIWSWADLHDARLYYEMAGFTMGRPGSSQRRVMDARDGTGDRLPATVPTNAPHVPYRDFQLEYPPLALGLLLVPRLITDNQQTYCWVFAGMMSAGVLALGLIGERIGRALRPGMDAAQQDRWRMQAAGLWMLLVVLGGPTMIWRFDVAVAVAAALGVWAALRDRWLWAGVAIGAGAAIKLWPGLLVPVMILWLWPGRRWRDMACLLAGTIAAVLVAHLPLLIIAPWDAAGYLRYYSGRGLQIESLWANYGVLVCKVTGWDATVRVGHGAFEAQMGRLSSVMLAMATAAFFMAYAAAVVTLGRAFVRRVSTGPSGDRPEKELLVAAVLAVTAIVMVTAKVLSPQFMYWLLPLGLVLPGRRGAYAAAMVLLILATTQALYPRGYMSVLRMQWPGTLGLLGRNLLLIGLAALAIWMAREPAAADGGLSAGARPPGPGRSGP